MHTHRGQDLLRDLEGIQEVVVPGQSGQVEEQSAARVGDVRHVGLAYEGIRERERERYQSSEYGLVLRDLNSHLSGHVSMCTQDDDDVGGEVPAHKDRQTLPKGTLE